MGHNPVLGSKSLLTGQPLHKFIVERQTAEAHNIFSTVKWLAVGDFPVMAAEMGLKALTSSITTVHFLHLC